MRARSLSGTDMTLGSHARWNRCVGSKRPDRKLSSCRADEPSTRIAAPSDAGAGFASAVQACESNTSHVLQPGEHKRRIVRLMTVSSAAENCSDPSFTACASDRVSSCSSLPSICCKSPSFTPPVLPSTCKSILLPRSAAASFASSRSAFVAEVA